MSQKEQILKMIEEELDKCLSRFNKYSNENDEAGCQRALTQQGALGALRKRIKEEVK